MQKIFKNKFCHRQPNRFCVITSLPLQRVPNQSVFSDYTLPVREMQHRVSPQLQKSQFCLPANWKSMFVTKMPVAPMQHQGVESNRNECKVEIYDVMCIKYSIAWKWELRQRERNMLAFLSSPQGNSLFLKVGNR